MIGTGSASSTHLISSTATVANISGSKMQIRTAQLVFVSCERQRRTGRKYKLVARFVCDAKNATQYGITLTGSLTISTF